MYNKANKQEEKTDTMPLEKALSKLNSLIKDGEEFPSACYRVCSHFAVRYSDLREAYDNQF